jgi:penicillin-binding protein 1A
MIEPVKAGPLKVGDRLVTLAVEEASRRAKRQPASPTPTPPSKNLVGWVTWLVGRLLALGVIGLIAGAGGGYLAYRHYSADLPDVEGLRSYEPPLMTRVFASDGRLIADFATERRVFVPYSGIPDLVKQAFVAAEDRNFWSDPGIDPLAIVRAAAFDLTHLGQGRRPIGASTITQQVAKNMLLDNQVSLARKVKEAILAMRIDRTLTKQRVLEIYLNEIYLGLQSYGVGAAAQAYFNKPLDQLSLSDAAFLAALPKAPNNYNPFRFPDAAKARRDWVLDRMVDNHAISAAQAAAAKAQPVVPAQYQHPASISGADWFIDEVRRELVARFGADATTQAGLMVRTSLDPALQVAAERSVDNGLVAYDRDRGGWRGPVAHLDLGGPASAPGWAQALAGVARPVGMLPDWRLGVVLGTTGSEAKIGWLDSSPPASGQTGSALTATGQIAVSPVASNQVAAGQGRAGTLLLADLRWARKVSDGRIGAAPWRMSDVVKPGDVVMVEPAMQVAAEGAQFETAQPRAAQLGALRGAPPVAERMVLRQIPLVQAALVSLDPATGRVVALVGGWNFDASQFNRATQAKRQPGSSFKPMVYLTALEHGISPSQQFLDAPEVIEQGPGVSPWQPHNFESDFRGPTSLRVALEQSINLVTLRVAAYVGMNAVADTAVAFHMVDSMPRVLPAAIGAVETTPMREAGAYASIAAGGREVVPSLIDSVQDRDGHDVWRPAGVSCPRCDDPATPPQLADGRKQIADPASVYQLINMMQGVVQRGTGVPAGVGLRHPLAGKTGTTDDYNDAWFSGFTADLVTVVWVGFDAPASLGDNETGAAVAAPIWHEYMAVALKDRPVLPFRQPPGVTLAQWDSGSGVVFDAFKPGQVPGASDAVLAESDIIHPTTVVARTYTPAAAQPVAARIGGFFSRFFGGIFGHRS